MGAIEIISASAGSGKTHRLAEVLEDALGAEPPVRPEAVMAMTFTVKAAETLRRRARTHLLARGQATEARRLTAARMGTVNAVCAALVGEFAFDLGLAPDLRTLEEDAAEHTLRRTLASVITPERERELDRLAARLDVPRSRAGRGPRGWDWPADVERIVHLARANDIAAEALSECARRSAQGLVSLLGEPEHSEEQDGGAPAQDRGHALDRRLRAALEAFLPAPEGAGDTTKKTAKVLAGVRLVLRRLREGRDVRWDDWCSLSTAEVAKVSEDAYAPLRAAAAAYDVHPRLHRDAVRAVTLVFNLAADALGAYAAHKREIGVLDFTDQEVLALGLLRRRDVRERLRKRIDLVLVDEFQDTSPIQLEIFLRLAEIAPRSVWVGDQKQAIYGFRGADPALMDAAIDQIIGGGEPQTLGKSWRSRPPLVDLTSDLFVPLFERHHIPEPRVRLTAAVADPAGLGPIVECWALRSSNREKDAKALAAATAELLADESARVRDPVTGDVRELRAGDVAILCRRNATAAQVARALEARGIAVRLARPGLLKTLEAGVIISGLALWVDERDALAAAELVRVAERPDDGDGWLAALLERPGGEAFAEAPIVGDLLEARRRHPAAGALEALDRVIEGSGVVDLCRRWGGAAARLANVEALRRQAVAYAQQREGDGLACTVNGLVRHLLDLAERERDERGVAFDATAVTVGTWHGAKGLEWPVTVLFELDRADPALAALGVHVERERETIDLAAPLARRWIRYWPYPLGHPRRNLPLRRRLAARSETLRAADRHDFEGLRLLYVAWTRARDRVVLAGRAGSIFSGVLEGPGGDEDFPGEKGQGPRRVQWAGRQVRITVRRAAPADPVGGEPRPDLGYPRGRRREHPPAHVAPSTLPGRGEAGPPQRMGPGLEIRGRPDFAPLGSAVHGFLAADRPGLDQAARREVARQLLERWRVADALEVDALLAGGEAFRRWVEERWPGARWWRELPLIGRLENGSIVRGEADLVLETARGLIVVDHKSFPGSAREAAERAKAYAGQVAAYAAIAAGARGAAVLGTFIHMPVSGVVIPLGNGASGRA